MAIKIMLNCAAGMSTSLLVKKMQEAGRYWHSDGGNSRSLMVIPFTIVGAIFLILTVLPQAFPIPGFAGLYAHTLGKFSNMFTVVYNANMGILSLIVGGQFTYSYAKIYQQEEKINIVPLNALFMMLMAMFITVPEMVYKNGSIQFVQSLKADNIIGGGIQVSASGVTRIGTTGLFTAIVIGWATV